MLTVGGSGRLYKPPAGPLPWFPAPIGDNSHNEVPQATEWTHPPNRSEWGKRCTAPPMRFGRFAGFDALRRVLSPQQGESHLKPLPVRRACSVRTRSQKTWGLQGREQAIVCAVQRTEPMAPEEVADGSKAKGGVWLGGSGACGGSACGSGPRTRWLKWRAPMAASRMSLRGGLERGGQRDA